jgi:hypothetical protein
MDVKVLSKLRQATRQTFLVSNLVGDSLLVRMRSASIGIVGMVAAVGLGLVIVVAQQGWPEVGTGPLPKTPSLVQNDPIVAPPVVSRPAGRQAQNLSSGQGGAPNGEVRLTGHRAVIEKVGEPVAVGQPGEKGAGRHVQPTQPQPPNAPSPPVVAQAPPAEGVPGKAPATPGTPQTSAGSPGHSGESHGHSGEAHGHSAEAPGHSGESHGHSAEAPGHSGEAHGHSAEAPGHSGEAHGHGH